MYFFIVLCVTQFIGFMKYEIISFLIETLRLLKFNISNIY